MRNRKADVLCLMTISFWYLRSYIVNLQVDHYETWILMSPHKIIKNTLYKSVIKVTLVDRLQRITHQDEITHTHTSLLVYIYIIMHLVKEKICGLNYKCSCIVRNR